MITENLKNLLANDTERFIAREEDFRSKPYRCKAGKLTIGIGWNLDAGISERLAALVFHEQVGEIEAALLAKFPWFKRLTEARRAALVSMAFQMGLQGLYGFKNTLRYIEAGDYENAARNMLQSKWARQTPARAERTAYMMRYGRFYE